MKNRCQNGTQKIMKWTKNATKINEKMEGRRGKEKKESQRGEATVQRQLGGGLINLKGGGPLATSREYFLRLGPPQNLLFPMPIFASIFDDILAVS